MSSPVETVSLVRPAKFNRLFGLLLAVGVGAAYWPALHGSFIWDDNAWTADILGLLKNVAGLEIMWRNPTALQQYYPLSGTTFWLDYHFWKLWTFPYHLENLLLHLTAVFLFWKLLHKLRLPGAWLAAGIFAVHPVMVESVAWITERKNVLSLVFFLGALLAYGRFNSFWQAAADSTRRWGAYALAFAWLALALLAKTTTFSFPAVVLLIGWWKNGRVEWRRDVRPSLPFFAIAIGLSAATAWLETNHVGAAGWEWNLTYPERCIIAGHAFWFYLGKLFYPSNLSFIYPRWEPNAGSVWQWLYPVAAIAALALLWLGRKQLGRGPVAAFLFFVGTLFPVLGFMNAYGMRYSFVWDHWVYLSSLGIITLSAAVLAQLAEHFKKPGLLTGCAALLLPLLALLTWHQSAMYADLETLWRTTIAKNPAAFLAHNNLGYILMEKNQVPTAVTCFENSLAINPRFSESHNNLGDALIRLGRTNDAVIQFKLAVELDPTSAASYYNWGDACLEMRHTDEAIAHFQKAVAIDPQFTKAYNNLGVALMRSGRTLEALVNFQRAVELEPDFADAHNNLANLLIEQNQTNEAIVQYQATLQVNPDFAAAHRGLANVLVQQGRLDEAIEHYLAVVRLQPDDFEVHYNLGVLLALRGRLDEAAAHFQNVIRLKPEYANAHGNLANVLVGQNKWEEAVAQYRQTIRLEPNSDQAHFKLGLAFAKQAKAAEAINEFQQALRLNPNREDIKEQLRLLGAWPD
jgi:tetratricopeptide (TPR) repeat protein